MFVLLLLACGPEGECYDPPASGVYFAESSVDDTDVTNVVIEWATEAVFIHYETPDGTPVMVQYEVVDEDDD